MLWYEIEENVSTSFWLSQTRLSRYTVAVRILKRYNSLFSRLLLSFFAVLLIPVLLLSFYYGVIGNSSAIQALKKQGEISCAYSASAVKNLVEAYRHKAYQLSNHSLIVNMLEADVPVEQISNSRPVYELLFTIMKGDVDFASAQVVSLSGDVRCSTHLFPPSYDLRYNRNDENPFFALSRAHKDTASLITITNRYTNANNLLVQMNILRRVHNEDGKVIGYVVIDIFQTAFSRVNNDFLFEDLILIDTANYLASSLLHTDRFGSFDKFDSLRNVRIENWLTSYHDKGYVQVLKPIEGTELVLAGIIDNQHHLRNMRRMYSVAPYVIIFGLVLSGIAAFFISRSIARPVNNLINSMKGVGAGIGELSAQPRQTDIHELLLLHSAFDNMVVQITSLLEAERKALESQLNPHFLYNTLNTVKSIASLHGEKEIVTIITRLGRLLRSSIENTHAEVTIQESIDLASDYLTIQKIRFGEKLRVQIDCETKALAALTPKFIIQPLVENALIHGLEPKIGDWFLSVKVCVNGEKLQITVTDNGAGIPSGKLPQNLSLLDGSGHIGLYNIYRRLELRYADSFRFTIEPATSVGTCVIIEIPFVLPVADVPDTLGETI